VTEFNLLFDLPAVVAGADPVLRDGALAERCEILAVTAVRPFRSRRTSTQAPGPVLA
jgi:hypothetical protein